MGRMSPHSPENILHTHRDAERAAEKVLLAAYGRRCQDVYYNKVIPTTASYYPSATCGPDWRSSSPLVFHRVSNRQQLDALNIPARYELWHTPASELLEPRPLTLCGRLPGANVTIPIKQAIIPLLDKIDPLAANIGAVNTIVHRDDYLHVRYNTDAPGLLHALAEHSIGSFKSYNQVDLKGYTIVFCWELEGQHEERPLDWQGAGIARMVVLNRHLERAKRLTQELQQYYTCPIFSLSDSQLSHSQ